MYIDSVIFWVCGALFFGLVCSNAFRYYFGLSIYGLTGLQVDYAQGLLCVYRWCVLQYRSGSALELIIHVYNILCFAHLVCAYSFGIRV